MQRTAALPLAILVCLFTSGCSMMAPQYSTSIPNVQKLKDAGAISAKVGTFTSDNNPGNPNVLSIRAASMQSPYGTYNAYLAAAIKQELELAGKLAPNSNIEVSGTLLKNDLDTSSFSIGYGTIEARFIVKKGSETRYDKVKAVKIEFESSFAGAVAIPKAQQEYVTLVQKLLASLYADPEFFQALK